MTATITELRIVVRQLSGDINTIDVMASAATLGFDNVHLVRDPEDPPRRMLVVSIDGENEPFAASMLSRALNFVAGVEGTTAEEILEEDRRGREPHVSSD